MSTTPKRLFGPAQLTAVAATLYTVPAATKTVVRYIHVSNPSSLPETFTLSIGADAAGLRIYDGTKLDPGQVLPIFCYHVLEAGEILQAFAQDASTVVLTIDAEERTP